MKLARRFRLQLRVIIIIAALVIIAVQSGMLAVSGYRSAEQALLSASLDDATRLGRTIEEEFRRLIEPAETELRLLAHDPLLQAGDPTARIQRLPVIADALDADKLLDALYVGYPDGAFVLFRPLRNAAARQAVQAPDGAALLLQSVAADPAGRHGEWRFYDGDRRLIETRPRPDYLFDPRPRPWYQAASTGDGVVLTQPYVFFTTRNVGVTLARRGVDGQAVIGLDLEVGDLSAAMDRLRGTPGTELALVDADGVVLAHPDTARLVVAEGDGVRLARIGELTTGGLNTLFDAGRTGTGILSRTLDVDGRAWQGTVVPVEGLSGKTSFLLVSIPADELLVGARDVVKRLGVTAATIVALAVVAGWLLSNLIAQPMQALSREVSALARFDFEHGVRTRSRVTEVDELAQVAHRTTATIRGFLGITAALSEETDLDRMLSLVLDQLVVATASVGGAVYLLDPAQDKLQRAALVDAATSGAFGETLPLSKGEAASPLAAVVAQAAADAGRGTASSEGLVAVALRTRVGDLVGVLVLDAPAGDQVERQSVIRFVSSLAGTAAVAIETRQLLGAQKAMLEGLIRLIAGAIDAKSAYTAGHCQRVPVIAQMLAEAAHDTTSGPYAGFSLTDADREALYVASWLHDCGKVTTPEYVVDKATKLETIYNRIHEIRTRFEVLKRDAEIVALKAIAAGADPAAAEAGRDREWATLDGDFAFVAQCNLGGEAMAPADIARLRTIGARLWRRTIDDRLGLSREELTRAAARPVIPLPTDEKLLADRPDHIQSRGDSAVFAADSPWGFHMEVPQHRMNLGELYNLSIARGTLTPEERHIINDHIVQTIIILSKLPLPRHLRAVPEIAGGHHERMDGKGYPRRLDGAAMSPLARMMAIADVFEALTAADRPYKPAKSLSQSIDIMAAMAREGHLDPELFELFLQSGVYRRYAEAYLAESQIDPVDIARHHRAAAE
jgi:HD-GYP domain-containing protein (c-di-GMP phosphodiesterase class II)